MAATRPETQDHKRKQRADAQRREATGEPIVITHRNLKFEIPSDQGEWPFEAMLAFEDNKAASVLRALLGPDDMERLLATRPTVNEFRAMAQQLAEAVGFESLGE